MGVMRASSVHVSRFDNSTRPRDLADLSECYAAQPKVRPNYVVKERAV